MAISLRATPGRAALQHHSLGWQRWRIQTVGPRSSLNALGDKKTQTEYELRQVESSHPILLRQTDHA